MEPWEVREWYGDFLDACNRHDLEAVRSFLDPAVRRAHLPGGADAWTDDLAELFRAFPDWRWRRIQLIVEDDRVAAHLRGHVGPRGAAGSAGVTNGGQERFRTTRAAAGTEASSPGRRSARAVYSNT